MSCNAGSWSCYSALRPWPYGPPLRGRAPRGVTGPTVAQGQVNQIQSDRQATAPLGPRLASQALL